MLNSRMVDRILERFGVAEVDLFASQESTQCPLWFSLFHLTSLGIDANMNLFPSGQAHRGGILLDQTGSLLFVTYTIIQGIISSEM